MIRFPTKKALDREKKIFHPPVSVLCGIALFFAVRCTQSTKPLEKPRLTAMADTTVNAGTPFDCIPYRFFLPTASPVTGGISRALMRALTQQDYLRGHVWALWDSGQQRFTVTITDAMHGVSDSATNASFVRVCRPRHTPFRRFHGLCRRHRSIPDNTNRRLRG